MAKLLFLSIGMAVVGSFSIAACVGSNTPRAALNGTIVAACVP